jgi:hypothetical protein
MRLILYAKVIAAKLKITALRLVAKYRRFADFLPKELCKQFLFFGLIYRSTVILLVSFVSPKKCLSEIKKLKFNRPSALSIYL